MTTSIIQGNNPILRIANDDEFFNINDLQKFYMETGGRAKGIQKFPIGNFFRHILGFEYKKPKRKWGYNKARVIFRFGSGWKTIRFNSDESAFKFMQQFTDDVAEKYGERGLHACKDYEFRKGL